MEDDWAASHSQQAGRRVREGGEGQSSSASSEWTPGVLGAMATALQPVASDFDGVALEVQRRAQVEEAQEEAAALAAMEVAFEVPAVCRIAERVIKGAIVRTHDAEREEWIFEAPDRKSVSFVNGPLAFFVARILAILASKQAIRLLLILLCILHGVNTLEAAIFGPPFWQGQDEDDDH